MDGILKWLFVLWIFTMTGCAASLESTKPSIDRTQERQMVDSENLYLQGVRLANAGQLVKAEQYLVAAIQNGYSEKKILPILMSVCISASRLRTALNYTEPFLTKNPDAWLLRYLVASIKNALGEANDAAEELEKVVEKRPDYAPAHYLLALIRRDFYKDNTTALAHFNKYLRILPNGEHALEVSAWIQAQKSSK